MNTPIAINEPTKRCSRCKKIKTLNSFTKHKRAKDGLRWYCKECQKKDDAKYAPIYAAAHPERIKAAIRKYLKNNRCKHTERGRKWRLENPKLYKQITAQSYRRRAKNVINRLNFNMRSALAYSLKRCRVGKECKHTWNMLNFTPNELHLHLEKQFTNGMTWANYGQWHIDHIIPIKFFTYTSVNDVEFKMCWRLENLRPLWAKENRSKSAQLVLIA